MTPFSIVKINTNAPDTHQPRHGRHVHSRVRGHGRDQDPPADGAVPVHAAAAEHVRVVCLRTHGGPGRQKRIRVSGIV